MPYLPSMPPKVFAEAEIRKIKREQVTSLAIDLLKNGHSIEDSISIAIKFINKIDKELNE